MSPKIVWWEMQTKEGIAVGVALHSSKQPMKRTGFICGGLWVSRIHLGTAALVLDHGEVRGCFILRSCLFRWKLSESLYYFRQSGIETVSFQRDGRQNFVTGEKKVLPVSKSNYKLVQEE